MDENELFVIFDEYPRYKIVEKVAGFIRGDDQEKKLRILEIGANAHKHLRLFLPQDEILFTDIELTQEMVDDPEFQQADGTALPFENGSFDLAVATDVLEHVPAEKRAALLSEAYRVAKSGAVITFPHDTEDVRAAEERVNQFYKSVNGKDYIWLKEHAVCGLPDTDAIDELLDSMECTYLRFFHGDIRTWETMYYSLFSATTNGAVWDFNRHINAYFNREIYGGDVSDSCYRAMYVLWHGETASLKAYLDKRSEPMPGKTEFLQELLFAQERIPVLNNLLDMQKQCTAQQTRADFLEQQNRQMQMQWKRDAAQWQKDNEQWKADTASWQEQMRGYEGHIAYLESQNQAMEEQWKADAAQWEQCSEQWKKDVAQWQKDNEQWKADTTSWQEQMRGYEGRIAYLESQNRAMEEQWKADAAQWGQCGEQWKRDVAQWESEKVQWQSERTQWLEETDRLSGKLSEQEAANNEMVRSLSWQLTKPLRSLDGAMRRLIHKN